MTKHKSDTGVTHDSRDLQSDTDVALGHFCRVVRGEHEGRYGVLDDVMSRNKHGRPLSVLVRTRDDDSMLISVDYDDILPDRAGRR